MKKRIINITHCAARVVMQAFKPILCFSVLLKVKNILEEGTS